MWGQVRLLRSDQLPPPNRPAGSASVSITRLTGGAIFCPLPLPQNSGATGPNYKIQTALDRSGNFVEGNLILLTSGSPLASQVWSKSKCLTIWRIWFCRALRPYKKEISQCNYKGRAWDTSKYDPDLSVSILKVKVIQGHEVKERSN